MKKQLQENVIANELRGASAFFPRTTNDTKNTRSEVVTDEKQDEQKITQLFEQKDEQVSKDVSKPLSRDLLTLPSSDEVEALAFRLRKTTKTKVNTEVPHEWKQRLDDLAHQLGIGKYELVMYIIARFLGEHEA